MAETWTYRETKGLPRNHYGFSIVDGKGRRVCKGFTSDEPHSRAERRTQGQTIAAVPQLLAALERILDEGMTRATVEQAVEAIRLAKMGKGAN